MALVAYDNSDSSDFEDEENENTTVIILNKKEKPSPSEPVVENESEDVGHNQTLFNLLPQPSNKKPTIVEEEDDEFLHKKETATNVKPKAKISVPSLSDFKDVESSVPIAKPKTGNVKGSGLLSILPQPKNYITTTTKSLIPHVLTQKPNSTTVKKKDLTPPIKKVETAPKSLAFNYSDDSDNDDEVQNDFFSMNKTVELPEDMPLDIDQPSTDNTEINNVTNPTNQKQTPNIQSYFKQNGVENHVELQPEYAESSNYETYYGNEPSSSGHSNELGAEGPSSSEKVLDEEAILKLCGARGKRKREEIQIVDVNQQEVLADAREWLIKGLMDDTSKRVSSSKRRGNEPTSQQRRKHQITYLAHQAKANEIELQNQWANNRMSKRQTQSKYGF